MSTRAKMFVPIGLAAIGLAACGGIDQGGKVAGPRGETPIEVADSSVTAHFSAKFVQNGKTLKAKIQKRKAQTIEVMASDANRVFQSIDVSGREWTIRSLTSPVSITRTAPAPGADQETDEVSITLSQGDWQKGSDTDYRYETLGKFTPATLSFAENTPGIPLFCFALKCKVRIHLK